MGIMPSPEYCHVTGLKTENYSSSYDLSEYLVTILGKRVLFRFHWNHKNSTFIENNKHILYGLIVNGKFPKEYGLADSPILDNQILEDIIRNSVYPKTPEDKANNLLNFLHGQQDFEGAPISYNVIAKKPDELAKKLYFKNIKEMQFYLSTLKEMGYVRYGSTTTMDGHHISDIFITYTGLSKVIELNELGNHSNRCFIAMSFSPEQEPTREALKKVITDLTYDPIIIDEQHIESDTTINDAIIAEIRKSKFVVSDFTQHKHGVYFETGFALGLKKPVIYTCSKKDFDKTHFDTNHYPHIIYEDLEELAKKLKDKIEAWIN